MRCRSPSHSFYIGSILVVSLIGGGGSQHTAQKRSAQKKAMSHLQKRWLLYLKKTKSTHGFQKASSMLLDLSLPTCIKLDSCEL